MDHFHSSHTYEKHDSAPVPILSGLMSFLRGDSSSSALAVPKRASGGSGAGGLGARSQSHGGLAALGGAPGTSPSQPKSAGALSAAHSPTRLVRHLSECHPTGHTGGGGGGLPAHPGHGLAVGTHLQVPFGTGVGAGLSSPGLGSSSPGGSASPSSAGSKRVSPFSSPYLLGFSHDNREHACSRPVAFKL